MDLSILEQVKAMLENKQYHRIDQAFRNSQIALDEINVICDYIDTDLKTKEERRFLINGLQSAIRHRDESQRKDFIMAIAPHVAIVSTMIDMYSFNSRDLKVIWDIGLGRQIIKRSQRKLRNYLSMLEQFREWIEPQDLEFGVFMASKMPRANVTNILANEYGSKLNVSQHERVEALTLLFHMNSPDEQYY